jgi:hypothetical protein
MNKKQLEKALTITDEDRRGISEDIRTLMAATPNVRVSFRSSYVFNCSNCEKVASHLNPYQILKSEKPVIKTTKGIFPLRHNQEPEFYSHLNYKKDLGYICDHCSDSLEDN